MKLEPTEHDLKLLTERDQKDINTYRDSILCTNTYAFLHAIYTILLLKEVNPSMVIPAHGYMYARLNKNVNKTEDKMLWSKYADLYKKEIETDIRMNCQRHITNLTLGILNTIGMTQQTSAGLPKDLYDSILKIDKKFYGYKQSPAFESILLSLRHMDVTEPDKEAREYMFTPHEICEMFNDILHECMRPIRDDKDLYDRTQINSIQYVTSILEIIYRIFSSNTTPYWYEWEQRHISPTGNTHEYNNIRKWINMVPVRTPEGILGLVGVERFTSKSIETPVEINGIVDRYLSLICKR